MLHHGIVKDSVRWEFVSSRTEFKTSLSTKNPRKTSLPDNSQSLLFHNPPLAGQAAACTSEAPRTERCTAGGTLPLFSLPPPQPPAGRTNYPDTQGHGALWVLLKNRPPELFFIFSRAFSCSLASSLPLVVFFKFAFLVWFPLYSSTPASESLC